MFCWKEHFKLEYKLVPWTFDLVVVPATNMEEAGFMTYKAVGHKVVIEMLWLLSFFTNALSHQAFVALASDLKKVI